MDISWHKTWDLLRRLAAEEVGLLIVLLGIAGGLWAFIALADEVIEGETDKFDHMVLLALRSPGNPADPLGPPWLPEMARDITALGSVGVLTLVFVIVVGYLVITWRRQAALVVFAAVAGGQLLSSTLKIGFERGRPDLVPDAPRVFSASFPSGHAMLSAVTYLTLAALLMRIEAKRRTRIYLLGVAVLLTLLVGVSRVYLGVHWPTDVLAGWCMGAAWAMLWWAVALWFQRGGLVEHRGEAEPESPD